MPSSTSEAPNLLDASHLSNESTFSTATTVPFISPSEDIDDVTRFFRNSFF
jgi:hypothetical protein